MNNLLLENQNKNDINNLMIHFIFVIILFAYGGYYLEEKKILQITNINGITFGLCIGIIFVHLFWFFIINKNLN